MDEPPIPERRAAVGEEEQVRRTYFGIHALSLLLAAVGCGGREETRDVAAAREERAAESAAPATQPTATSGANPWAPPPTTVPAPPVPVVEALAKPGVSGDAARGAATYAAKCASCHGAEARGDTAMATKHGLLDFRSPNVRALTTADLAKILHEGRGSISESAHPDAKLTEDDVRNMVAFIQSLR